MKHAHSKYDGVQDSSGQIPDDEPVFLLRGGDPLAAATVRYWAQLSRLKGTNLDKLDAVEAHATEMSKWARK